jgi:4'-phosphopantetheinyl transferase
MKLYKAYISKFDAEEYEKYFSMMSSDRQADVNRKRFDDDKKRSVLGEKLVRLGIAELSGVLPEEIILRRTDKGKPYAEGLDIAFSVSHSEDMVICAVGKGKIGADVEHIRHINRNVSRFACTDSDKEFVFSSEYGWENRFFELWTAKEAYVKSLGTGISDLKMFDYLSIKPFCKTFTENGYIITIYCR